MLSRPSIRSLPLAARLPLPVALSVVLSVALLGCPDDDAGKTIVGAPGITADVIAGVDVNAYAKDGGSTAALAGDVGTPGATALDACTPDCFGKACGPDGCGGTCGGCIEGFFCGSNGLCVADGCEPNCAGKACGPDGCGGQCGACSGTMTCHPDGYCTSGPCVGSCIGKQCGGDGCGESCGTCGPGTQCNQGGQCIAIGCTPDCFGKQCGADGCGGQCGKCAPTETCTGAFQCAPAEPNCGGVPEVGVCKGDTVTWCVDGNIFSLTCQPAAGLVCGWSAAQSKFDCVPGQCQPACAGKGCGPDGCGGKCGICPAGQSCAAGGICQANCVASCAGKQCGSNGCGGSCGTCPGGQVCGASGLCKAGNCVPNCQGKQCGPDGCGGKCGICPAGQSCQAGGICAAGGCTADCVGKQCGSDGCGGSCGFCPGGQSCGPGNTCQAGGCVASCAGKQCGPDGCGGKCGICPAGQSCHQGGLCEAGGCTPACTGKQCGSDGCGGKCGLCPSGKSCNAQGLCQAPGGCVPSCANKSCGPDGCGGACGMCEAGTSCDATGLCTPGVGGGGDCGDVDYKGTCDGDTLSYCASDSLVTVDCAAQPALTCGFDTDAQWFDCMPPGACTPSCTDRMCGDDGCGGSCGQCPAGQLCDASGGCGDGGGGCADLGIEGTCNGDTLSYCGGDAITDVDCAAQDKTCAFDPDAQWYDCLPPGAGCLPSCIGKAAGDSDGCGGLCEGPAPCGDVGATGQCVGEVLQYCAGDLLQASDCAAQGKVCGLDPDYGWYDCLQGAGPCVPTCTGKAAGDADGCGGVCGGCGEIGSEGACDGDTLQYCSGGSLVEVACGELSKTCGFDAGFGWYDCLESGACIPDCGGKAGGETDGCGGICPSVGLACGDLTEQGQCDGDTLSYCGAGEVKTYDCTEFGKSCGFDAEFGWFDCLDGAGCVPDCAGKAAGDPDGCGGSCMGGCGGLDAQGACAGTVLSFCQNDTVTTLDCADQGKVCAFDEPFGWFDCVTDSACVPDCVGKANGEPDGCGGTCAAPPTGDCGDVTTSGQCEGTTLSYCASGTLKTVDCAQDDKVCGYDAAFAWFDCVVDSGGGCVPDCAGKACGDDGCGGQCGTCGIGEACEVGQCVPAVGGCGAVTQKGECAGDTLTYCANGTLKTVDCAAQSKVCGYDAAFDWFDCVTDGGGCVPACGDQQCGDDGCGGSCGDCAGGETCGTDGLCVADGACGAVTSQGQCDGDTLIYCGGGALKTYDCASVNKVCGFDAQFDWYDCVEPSGCVASCDNKTCGDDGCGDSCGTCAMGSTCSAAGQCEAQGACGDVTQAGVCDGNTLTYCANGALKSYDCTAFGKVCQFVAEFAWYDCVDGGGSCTPSCGANTCGPDGCGGSCGVCGAGQECSGGTCVATGAGNCGAVTKQGICDGDTLSYCASGTLKTYDCTANGKTCGYDAQFDWYDCIEAATCTASCDGKSCGDDGCGGSCGSCGAGSTCDAAGQCVPDGGACGDIGKTGQCDGNTLIYCASGQLQTYLCGDYGKICGYDPAKDWFDCIPDPNACVPVCDGKSCGDDGCGGSCGTCGADAACVAGQCNAVGNCGGVTSDGQCDGSSLSYCDNGTLKQVDCPAFGKICGYDPVFSWYDCVVDPNACVPACSGKQCGDDGCGGSCGGCDASASCQAGQCVANNNCGTVTAEGQCAGDTLSYCANNELTTADCTAYGKVCGWSAANSYYDCIQPADSTCGDVTTVGQCDGDVLNYCDAGTLQSLDCAQYNGTCAYDAANGYYDCAY